jgi:replication factor A1
VYAVKPLSNINTKSGNPLSKRSIELIDQSNRSIELTLWGERAENFQEPLDHPVLACKNVKVGDYGGKNLSALSSSQIELNPDLPQAHDLRAWYDSLDPNSISSMIHSLSNTQIGGGAGAGTARNYPEKNLVDIRDQSLGKMQTDYFTIRGTIMSLKSDRTLAYMACASPECSKKVTEMNGGYHCDKCNKTYNTYKMRYIFQMSISDHTNNQWVNVFNDTGEIVLGVTANELISWKNTGDHRFEQCLDEARYKTFVCKASAQEESYQDERRVKVRLMTAHPIDFVEDSRRLLGKIRELSGQ